MHGLVHPAVLGDEPEVDGAQRRDHPADDAGLLLDLAHRGLLGGLARPRCGPWAATTAAGRAGPAGRSPRPRRRRGRRPGRRPRSRRRCAAACGDPMAGPRGARPSGRGRWTCGDGNDRAAVPPYPAAAPRRPRDPAAHGLTSTLARRVRSSSGARRRRRRSRARPAECGRGDGAGPAGRRRAGRPVRRRRAPAVPGRRQRAGRAARPAGRRPGLHHRRPPGRRAGAARRAGRTRSGRPASRSARSAPAAAACTVEITTFRADAYDRVTRNPVVAFGDTIADDLVRRDFTVNAMAVELTGAERRFVDPHGGLAALAAGVLDTPATPEESFADDPLRMLRAARFVAQLGLTPAPRVLAAMTAMAGELARITRERVQAELSKLICGAFPRRGARAAGRHRAGRARAARGAGDAAGHRRAHAAQGRLHALAGGAGAGHRPRDRRPGPGAAAGRAAARHRQAGHPAQGAGRRGSASTTTRWSGPRWCGAGCASCATRRRSSTTSRQLVYLHLRFHGYGTGRVDRLGGAPLRHRRRPAAGPAAQAGPLRLHHPQPPPGRRPAAQLRLAGGADRRAARPGGARRDPPRPGRQRDHASCSGSRPGPLVGQAYKHLLALRMERGPLARRRGRGRAAPLGRGERARRA